MQLGKQILKISAQKKMSLTKLAKTSGVPLATIHGWTTGRSALDLNQVRRIAEILEIPFFNLIFGEPEKGRQLHHPPTQELFLGNIRVKIETI